MSRNERRGILRRLMNRWVIVPLVFLLLLLGALFGFRAYRIAGLPDIGDPFDVEAFTSVEVNDEKNALIEYKAAGELLVPLPLEHFDARSKALEEGWASADAHIRQWVADNRPAMEVWRKGTEKPEAHYDRPSDMQWGITGDLAQSLRAFGRLALLEGSRLRGEGDLAGAWKWYNTQFRCSRNIGWDGRTHACLLGASMHAIVAEPIVQWAADERVNGKLLQQALTEIQSKYRVTRNSIQLKHEYASIMQYLDEMDEAGAELRVGEDEIEASCVVLFLANEPELSRRVYQQLFHNWLAYIDQSHTDRMLWEEGKLQLFMASEDSSPNLKEISREKFTKFYNHSLAPWILDKWNVAEVIRTNKLVNQERARQATLVITLAAQLYYRVHGKFPKHAEELLNGSLHAIPVDPLDREAGLIRYRHSDEGTAVWSVGSNGTDEGGNFDLNRNGSFRPFDLGFQIVAPGKPTASNSTKEDLQGATGQSGDE